jgi:hypothetical protein
MSISVFHISKINIGVNQDIKTLHCSNSVGYRWLMLICQYLKYEKISDTKMISTPHLT